MIQWKEEAIIEANIEKVWDLFRDKNIKRIMPKVEQHKLIEKREEEVGAKHEQKYREGKRVETYIVETERYENHEDKKIKQVSFVLGKAFQITTTYTFVKIDETHTRFIYEGQNRGVNFVGRAMLKLGGQNSNNDVVKEFINRVRAEALKN